MKPVTPFRVGDQDTNKRYGWEGIIRAVECGICAEPYLRGNPTCAHRNFPCPMLTIEHQGAAAWFLKPWCLPANFDRIVKGPSVWELLRNGPLTPRDWLHRMRLAMHES